MFEEVIKHFPDFPKEGIDFIDVLPFLQDKRAFADAIAEIGRLCTAPNVATVEARGFLFAAPLLIRPGTGVENVIPIRKKGKLPFSEGDLVSVEIVKEYGHDNVFFRKTDIAAGKVEDGVIWVSVLDDVLATGGTAKGIADALNAVTVNKDGKEYPVRVKEFVFLCEIDGLPGRALLESIAPVHSIMHVTE